MPKKINALFLTALIALLVQTKYKEMPISKNNIVQTGAKTQPGGLKLGFCRVKYQPETLWLVKIEPIKPAPWQIIIAKINFNQLICFKAIIFKKIFKKFSLKFIKCYNSIIAHYY